MSSPNIEATLKLNLDRILLVIIYESFINISLIAPPIYA